MVERVAEEEFLSVREGAIEERRPVNQRRLLMSIRGGTSGVFLRLL